MTLTHTTKECMRRLYDLSLHLQKLSLYDDLFDTVIPLPRGPAALPTSVDEDGSELEGRGRRVEHRPAAKLQGRDQRGEELNLAQSRAATIRASDGGGRRFQLGQQERLGVSRVPERKDRLVFQFS